MQCRVAIIADAAVSKIGQKLKEEVDGTLFLFQGEKTREEKQRLEDQLMEHGFGRDTLLIALGGGAATDLVAYLASTYMRGVPLILIPTTLLAMVDAAIGGKTGVDTPFGKNLIGTFYSPQAIFIDTSLLATLPSQEWMHGLAEILKMGLISDEMLWATLEKSSSNWKHPEILSDIISTSIQRKREIVEQDPQEEKGLRRILNFGHTIAHALEKLSHFQMPHGMAVAIGCQMESVLSHRLGYLNENTLQRILKLYRTFEFPSALPKEFSKQHLIETMRLDKKSKGADPRFVLIDRIGHALEFEGQYCRSICAADL